MLSKTLFPILIIFAFSGCGGASSTDVGADNVSTDETTVETNTENEQETETETEGTSDTPDTPTTNNQATGYNSPVSPGFSGNVNGYFIGHSALNDIVADHVATTASISTSASLTASEATTEGISLENKIDVEDIASIINGGDHNFDFILITEAWDYQNYKPEDNGADDNPAPEGCPDDDYAFPTEWTSNSEDFYYSPYYIQVYHDAFVCAKTDTTIFYLQTWSLGYNEVTDGATRKSDPDFTRPDFTTELEDFPDLPLSDRIEYEGVKWEKFIAAANRPDVIFIPAAYALAEFMRAIENGTAPGFEGLSTNDGLYNSELAWADYLFYQDQYHLSAIGQYFMSQIIYAAVFNEDPTGIPIGTGAYPVSESFPEGQYELRGVSDAEYASLLSNAGASGVYDLRGHNNLDYVHDSLRDFLQTLAWDTVNEERNQIID